MTDEPGYMSQAVVDSFGMQNLKFVIAVDGEGNQRSFFREGAQLRYAQPECDEQVTTDTVEIGVCKKNLQILCTWRLIRGVWVCV